MHSGPRGRWRRLLPRPPTIQGSFSGSARRTSPTLQLPGAATSARRCPLRPSPPAASGSVRPSQQQRPRQTHRGQGTTRMCRQGSSARQCALQPIARPHPPSAGARHADCTRNPMLRILTWGPVHTPRQARELLHVQTLKSQWVGGAVAGSQPPPAGRAPEAMTAAGARWQQLLQCPRSMGTPALVPARTGFRPLRAEAVRRKIGLAELCCVGVVPTLGRTQVQTRAARRLGPMTWLTSGGQNTIHRTRRASLPRCPASPKRKGPRTTRPGLVPTTQRLRARQQHERMTLVQRRRGGQAHLK
mmetsp:Transcript_54929/g.160289  ORF Transcript_54929/g.160289 Transcript_54929/m.160289 type:complete len:302 (+) Transcript_54929:477-1382(+)